MRDIMKKRGFELVLSLFFFILVSLLILNISSIFVLSESIECIGNSCQTEKSMPEIELMFDERIIVDEIFLWGINSYNSYINIRKSTGDFLLEYEDENKTILITPQTPLISGNYKIEVTIIDYADNVNTYLINLVVDIPLADFVMIQPRFSVMNSSKGDVIIKSYKIGTTENKWMNCKYVHGLFGGDFDYIFSNAKEFDEVTEGSSKFTLRDYDLNMEFQKNLILLCKDELETYQSKMYSLKYDLIPPKIVNITFSPPIMITRNNDLYITLFTDENAFCKVVHPGISSMITSYFNGNIASSESLESSYTKKHVLNLKNILPQVNNIYYFNVTCNDLTNRIVSNNYPYEINLDTALTVLVDSPKRYVTNESLYFRFITNKPAYCTYKLNDVQGNEMTTSNVNQDEIHNTFSKIPLSNEGSYSLDITCNSNSALSDQTTTQKYGFTVDRSPPSSLQINLDKTFCEKNKISFSAEAYDDFSGIDYYQYTIQSSGNTLIDWTNFSSSVKLSDTKLNSTNGKEYTVYVRAYDYVGNQITAFNKTRFDSTGISCDNFPPRINVTTDYSQNKTYVEIKCTDDLSGCNKVLYNLVTSGDCVPSITYSTKFIIDKKYLLCYYANDSRNNKITGEVAVNVFTKPDNSKHCFNKLYEPSLKETDLDCGGECIGCSDNKRCLVNNDCISGYCGNDNFCIKPTCFDSIKNGKETDIDCGGIDCVDDEILCNEGLKCNVDSDCSSNFCSALTLTCEIPTCFDNSKNGDETDIDCGGDCKKCDDTKYCKEDKDCESDFCNNMRCQDYKDKDCDLDSIPDYWEKDEFNCPINENGCYTCANPNDDSDNDGLKNKEEFKKKTNPFKSDTDGDGYSDGIETALGFDPIDPESHPTNWMIFGLAVFIFLIIFFILGIFHFDYFKPIRDEQDKVNKKIREERKIALEKQRAIQQKLLQQKMMQQKALQNSKQATNFSEKQNKQSKIAEKIDTIAKQVDLSREKERAKIFNTFDETENQAKVNETNKLNKEESKRDRFKRILEARKNNLNLANRKNINLNNSNLNNSNLNNNITFKNMKNIGDDKLNDKKLNDKLINDSNNEINDNINSEKELFLKNKNKANLDNLDDLDNIVNKKSIFNRFSGMISKKENETIDDISKKKDLFSDLDKINNRKDNFEKNSMFALDNIIDRKTTDRKNNDFSFRKLNSSLNSGMDLTTFELTLKRYLEQNAIEKIKLKEYLNDLELQGKITTVEKRDMIYRLKL